ncbi:MAG: 4Fe-4S cluster-binding domain-containing protein, partial [Muribaculaceae bacterium]|nr:4Fe-4S cluster-binding domain-containing protein [Muribaculaceae bacterium]
ATPRLLAALEHIDVVVDGPFILAQRDTSLHFRGSANQRIIDVQQSLATGKVSTITL